ncbi:MAG TPA: adaptor protein MecA [Lachnospiraceae bacterium]|nr:adaptor protein MecA [Lachnospiraceae bacterium]
MKIEKVNDHQIRCTLTKDDLANREIKLSELAYGTQKAKDLFRDMMQQASFQYGFEAEDIPLMIEAIPLNSDCIVLIITKVEDPEELDTRFSKFAPSVHDDNEDSNIENSINSLSGGADDVLDLFKKIHNGQFGDSLDLEINKVSGANLSKVAAESIGTSADIELTKLFSFPSIRELTKLAGVLKDFYNGKNTLFKNTRIGNYTLVVTKGKHTPEEYNKICNILSEYGVSEKSSLATVAYLEEHYESVIKDTALQTLTLV